jgi:hypothetical protein
MINTVYKIHSKGFTELYGEAAQPYIEQIQGKNSEKDDGPYIFYEKGQEVYILSEASPVKSLTFPEPEEYGTTSMQLFAMAITYSTTMARLLLKRLKTPLTLLGQLRKGAAVILPIVIIAVLIFIVAVMAKG